MSELQATYLRDYTPPPWLVDEVELHIDLDPTATTVRAALALRSNPAAADPGGVLRLDGRQLDLLEVSLDGIDLPASRWQVDDQGLTVTGVPPRGRLETLVRIAPAANTALEGLYLSGGLFCTQCEAEGFRKITYYPDRPDVMARYTVTLAAERAACPVLLANGNRTAAGELPAGRHFATFVDPFPKPSYLFAVVAGDLALVEDTFATASGRRVSLQIFVAEGRQGQCGHAMAALRHAMRWDEERFGLECDLDEYKVVAIDDFNSGAMENKGLNLFNAKGVLADPQSATDADYQWIEGTIAHEYFHNWTGNRVTCRDWFQLSLKEGLTVYRDQEFSADFGSRPVKRISDVRLLRTGQFAEDSGPMAHPVRPESYVEINNFYTATVYNKGGEVVRMLHTLFGADGFRRGHDLFIARHDGQAVTTDDFLAAMAEANGADLGQFARWYGQAGTPRLEAAGRFDPADASYTLTVRQSTPPTPGQPDKEPLLIPLAVGLLGADGRDLPLQLAGEGRPGATTRVLRIAAAEETFRFTGLPGAPLPSLLRGFSAPVRLVFPYTDEELAFLFAHDSDPFNRWEAGQRLATRLLLAMVEARRQGGAAPPAAAFIAAFRAALTDPEADPAFLALALTLPAEGELADAMTVADPLAVHAARQLLRRRLAAALGDEFSACLAATGDRGPYAVDAAAIGRRSLKNLCLAYLAAAGGAEAAAECLARCRAADNLTDRLAALGALAGMERPEYDEALDGFYASCQGNPLVIDKWLTIQATSCRADTLARVGDLLAHPAFNLRNPNRVRALVGAFAHANPACFHAADGAGYRFVADRVIEVDRLNPQLAARLAGSLSRWRRYGEERQAQMRGELERIRAQAGLSRDVGEIVGKSLRSEDA